MNKKLAEALASIIPHKMTRNRWRGILRYGPIRALKLIRSLRKEKNTPVSYYLAVCAMAKNEGPYFPEWIEWHRKMGVDKFYIYDNESDDNTKQILEPYIASGLVDYTFWEGKKQQLPIYDHCFETHRLEARWIAVIDLDEFIVPLRDKSIPEFLKPLEQYPSVEINWLVYGSGGAKEKTEGSVMERFTKHSLPGHKLNRHVKSIVDPRRIFTFIGSHEAARINGKAVDSNGSRIRKGFRDREPQHDIIRINHYAIKSYEEFLGKRARGRSRVTSIRGLDYFDQYDLNDIEEESGIYRNL
ncbi:glycosyltransferase family 92 protein [Bacteroidales bacterium OttesenSCG-928-M11]|nr:glycosyltransferase family 92 protein [Bacteroidales bacterium OttesenSCG-928-M11]